MSVSVVLPAHRGGPELEAALAALAASSPPPDEVIVVDDASTDHEPERLAKHYGFACLRLEKPSGPAAARNRGAEAARGERLVFLDSDVEVRPDTVARLAAALEDHPAVFGSYDDDPHHRDLASLYANLRHHFVHQHSESDTGTFWAACGAVRRSAFLKAGGFCESYPHPSVEDIDLGMRLAAQGDRPRLLPEIQVRHWKRWTLRSLWTTDICYRALPWSRKLLEAGSLPPVLNLDWSNRLSAALAWMAVLWLTSPATSLTALVAWLVVNRELAALFARQRCLPCLALHFLHHLYASAVYVLVALHFTLRRRGLALLLLAAACNYLVWLVVWPPLHPPDETQHFLYVRDMAREPRWRMGFETTVPEEMVWLGDWSGLGATRGRMPRHTRAEAQDVWHNLERLVGQGQEAYLKDDPYGRFVPNGPFRRYHPPLYPALAAPSHAALAHQPIVARLAAQRLVSVALALLTVALVVAIGRELWPRSPRCSLALGIMVAFHPTFSFYASVANNEMLEVALATLFVWLTLRARRLGFGPRRVGALGLVLALGLLTRLSFLAVVASSVTLWRRAGLLLLAIPLLLAGWWYVPLLTGETGAVVAYYKAGDYAAPYHSPLASPLAYFRQFDWDRWVWLGLDYWCGPLGTGMDHPQATPGDLLAVALAVAAAFLALLALASLLSRKRRSAALLDLALPTFFFCCFYQAADYLMFRDGEGFFLIRDQYLLAGIAGQMALVVTGGLLLAGRVAPPLLALALLALNLHTLKRILTHYYPASGWQGLVEQAATAWWLPIPLAFLLVGLALASSLALVASLANQPGSLPISRETS
ncbi:MAG: hypothetical protein AMXMBFR33_61660 [Candidatus Xenobia bacterium]